MDADRPWKEDLRTLTRQLTGPTSVNDGEQWSSSVERRPFRTTQSARNVYVGRPAEVDFGFGLNALRIGRLLRRTA